ncbi:MAG: coenzyme F420-0:L-glutamate ligase, partial [Chloroflexi bacterium]|nr:coenzyme F420-0:L-glutamate ligase [Chloroflexota bacterium]
MSRGPLVLTPLPGLPEVQPGDDLAALIADGLTRAGITPQPGDILVLAQKIVSKAEGRFARLDDVRPSARARALAQQTHKDPRLVELILRESRDVLRAVPGVLIVEHRLGFVCANAGIDRSNVPARGPGEWVLLLPEDPDASADRVRAGLEARYRVPLGVLIIDSHGRAWRLGTVGMAIGLSGVPALVDMRGQPDREGYRLRVTQIAVADELAAAASLMMGQAAEGTPVVHVRGFPYPLAEGRLAHLLRPR